MERLDILEKIYLYGETLSSEEMNLIVSHINIVIDAVNALIRNNNGVGTGHWEMRYILSPFELPPTKPATGTNGLSGGWSNLYLLPEEGSGNSTWMSMCFSLGEDSYGEWSTPICLSSGTIVGLRGPKGDDGVAGSFVSRVFVRSNTKPDRPVGGTYAHPMPDYGWYDSIPEGTAIIWSSSRTFYSNDLESVWSDPALESDTATLDIEFSPSEELPPAPVGNVPFSNHEDEGVGWYDPSSPNFNSVGTMIWRAERKVSNGEYDGGWTITRIFGEQGIPGINGLDGGHYEFRYRNYKPTLQLPTPTKPATGSNGKSGGWSESQQTLTEIEIKEGMFTWMTLCFVDLGVYGEWTDPIRITGANGIDGEDGTEQEFMYTRNNTGNVPATPPQTLKNEEALFGDLGYWTDPNSGVTWTDDPQGVNDILMWEFVTTRVKEGTIWGPFSTPVVWAKWGKQGRIGQMSYLAGEWNSQTTYVKTAERNPVVYHNGNYYYLKGELTFEGPNKNITEITSTGDNPTGTNYTAQHPNPWAAAENYEMVFTDILFVNTFAKLQSFIISGDWMFSLSGTLYYRNGSYGEVYRNHNYTDSNNVTYTPNTAYLQFDPSYPNMRTPSNVSVSTQHPNPNFVPDFAIDSLSGRCFFWKGYFKGDVYANSLHLGNHDLSNLPSTIDGINGSIGTINTNLGNKLEIGDVSVSNDTTSGGLTKKTITITKGNTTKTFTLINAGNFVLTDIGRTGPAGSYFKVSTEGLMEAHNAIVYGTVFATAGQFSGEVNATKFIAGDPGGLNITTTGDAISFNYGAERRAWFTTKDPSGNDTSGMYLYLRNPDDPSTFITIDFANLTFKPTNVSGSATRLNTIYRDITGSPLGDIYINSSDGKYYANAGLTIPLTASNYFEKFTSASVLVEDGSYYRICYTEFFKRVLFTSGVKSQNSADENIYWAVTELFGNGRTRLYALGYAVSPSSSQVYMGQSETPLTGITGSQQHLSIDGTSKWCATASSSRATTDSTKNKITALTTFRESRSDGTYTYAVDVYTAGSDYNLA